MAKQKAKTIAKAPAQAKQKLNFLLLLVVLVATLIIYFPSLHNALTNWDDQEYITNNAALKTPASQNIAYHFKDYHMGNYHPLTMISLNMNYKEPVDPFPFHLWNLILHVLNTALVFLFVFLLTNKNLIAFISSLLFALHPMHVESVAWAAERKDVLYAFFFLAALCSYIMISKEEKSKMKWIVLTTLFFVLSLFSKGQAVVLPVIFILIDIFQGKKLSVSSIVPKIPWLVLSLAFGIIAILAQGEFKALQSTETYSILDRFLFACYGIVMYIYKLLVPINLSCFYPFPVKNAGAYTPIFYLCPVIVLGIVFIIWKFFRKNNYLEFAFLFFVISISIVLQLLPVGGAIIADRYTYIPYLGFFILFGKLFSDAYEKLIGETWRNVMLAVIPIAIIIFSFLTYQRIEIWKDSLTLWDDAISKDQTSPKPFLNRGKILQDSLQNDKAMADFNKAIELNPNYAEALYNRGLIYYFQKDYEKAIGDYSAAITANPNLKEAWHNRAGTYFTMGKYEEALNDAKEAQRLGYNVDPKFFEAIKNAKGPK